ncbi:MAG: type II toxin-antitoxin system Phd/YefM family antitoxin [Candidatus Eremiobacteraeota bacterium]|nr:type II toxin-antitoxin system Phd/YefM family antitoxin [Candidatus Eremiobacteraeota bacterium]MBV9057026.1 type II toxin-antitoxin system Phd/YefM family antitoxin [Candidatus Eremiobacteraeota bacterium]MBV9700210.1 type II toxin-antitoxin system Phd/YefM family antitoxin [Candidatus Eremiobacteraeota bacterium]
MATKTWPASEAKARLSDLLDAALRGEPQIITRRGNEAVVVVSAQTYRARIERKGGSLSEFFARSPHREVEIAPPRDRRAGRDVKL